MPFRNAKSAMFRRKAFARPRLLKTTRRRRGKVFRPKLRRFQTASKVVIRQPSGVPDRLFVKLKYSTVLFFTSTTGGISQNQFRGNAIQDPDVTGVGGQPYLFDQWATLYNRYRVRGSSVKAQATQSTSNTGNFASNVTVMLVPSNNTTTFSISELAREQPYTKWIQTKPYGSRDALIKSYMSTAKIMGVRKSVIANEQDYSSAVSTNPNVQWYWNVLMYTSDEQTTSSTTPIHISLTYYVELYDRQRPTVS